MSSKKKAAETLLMLLFAFMLLLPVCSLICACLGYSFRLKRLPWYCAIIAALSLAAVIFYKNKDVRGSKGILLCLAAPLSLITAVICVLECAEAAVFMGAAVFASCSFYLCIKCAGTSALKKASIIAAAVLLLPACLVFSVAILFGGMAQNTVLKTFESPGGEYRAELIDSDQGALGGDTLVNIVKNGGVNTPLFDIENKPKTVYKGEWGEFEDMQIFWKSESCLVINSSEYYL